ncbi:MAG: NUDIX domain-containing protein [Myxococcales bacterium]|nr:NUDIX domain-containing protein [Myxococcales bacterium]
MAGLDLIRLGKTIHYLLRHPDPTGLVADGDGWFCVEEVARVVSRTIRRPVATEDVDDATRCFVGARLEVVDGRVRIQMGIEPERYGGPDLLFHAVPRGRLPLYEREGRMWGPNDAGVHLSRHESLAWRVAHRTYIDPVVLIVDAARARRDGVEFVRTRGGLYLAMAVPLRHVLNLRPGYTEQASAGGFVVDWSTGAPRIGLIRVARRHGLTWEVAKGKLEYGEPPVVAAVREMREEMGVDVPVRETVSVGSVRYGFYTREGAPRLKTIYLFLIELAEPFEAFRPLSEEGIEDARWFALDEALEVLVHPSLRIILGRLLRALDLRAAALGLPGGYAPVEAEE